MPTITTRNFLIDALSNNFENETVSFGKGVKLYNLPCSFDIETTSTERISDDKPEKVAFMYEWTFGLNGTVLIGRTWEQFNNFINALHDYMNIQPGLRLVIYVHNLSYEFQFFCRRLAWHNVFCTDDRKPIYAVTNDGFEFRCSYLLSGYSLDKLSDNLTKYPIHKMSGDLNYSKIRHSGTPLLPKELKYCENDVRVIMAYIAEKIEGEHGINNIPYTKTGYVRNYCRQMCFYSNKSHRKDKKYAKYHELMKNLILTPELYLQLKRAFAGGFTHANAFYSGLVIDDVESFDFSSSYPYVMVSKKFPMSKAIPTKITSMKQFENYLDNYCCLFDIEFYDIESKCISDDPISVSKCFSHENVVENNGRIVSANKISITLTELDFKIIRAFYSFKSFKVYNFSRFYKDYLPKDLIFAILKLYGDKTTLKGVHGKEAEYLNSKEKVNASYGMMVTDICRPEITFNGNEWVETVPDLITMIDKYNKSKNRFLYYPWGVWVTAHARYNLFTGIKEFKSDYIYSDTDSIKGKNAKAHQKYIDDYNSSVIDNLKKAMDYHNLPFELCTPKTIKGKIKILGVWEDEGTYDKFKTLGAKRYMIEKDGKINITVAGLDKKKTVPYLIFKYADLTIHGYDFKCYSHDVLNNVFKSFSDDLYISPEYTGKSTHTYIDYPQEGEIIDYLGNTGYYSEFSSIHLSESDYSLKISDIYADYITGLREEKHL